MEGEDIKSEGFLSQLYSIIRLGFINHYSLTLTGSESDAKLSEQNYQGLHRSMGKLARKLVRNKAITEPYGFLVSYDCIYLNNHCVVPNLHIYGRYLKRQRYLSQTPWWTGGSEKRSRVGSDSVEEALANLIKENCFTSDDRGNNNMTHTGEIETTFYSLGREDRDVRMLGEGRPFLIKLRCLISELTTGDISRENHAVEALSIRIAHPIYVQALKNDGSSHSKSYRAIVYVHKKVPYHFAPKSTDASDCHKFIRLGNAKSCFISDDQGNAYTYHGEALRVLQKTPIRVLHRRARMSRERHIHSMNITFLNPHYAICNLVCSAGMYVKEFVHGDHGRTTPSLQSIFGTPCDILQLDVMSVND